MLFVATKILQQFLYPFNLALLSLVMAWLCLGRNRVALGRALLGIGFLLLAVPGIPRVGDAWLAQLESGYAVRHSRDYPTADAIVVLGGTTVPTAPPRIEAEELNGSRLLAAARLYQQKKAPWVVVTGGMGYHDAEGQWRTEADDMRDILVSMGVPASAIVLESRSRTTYENAVEVAKIVRERRWSKVLLVTSAFHMFRSVGLFERQEIAVIPVPAGHLSVNSDGDWRNYLPTATGISRTSIALKETAGRWAYRLMGKL